MTSHSATHAHAGRRNAAHARPGWLTRTERIVSRVLTAGTVAALIGPPVAQGAMEFVGVPPAVIHEIDPPEGDPLAGALGGVAWVAARRLQERRHGYGHRPGLELFETTTGRLGIGAVAGFVAQYETELHAHEALPLISGSIPGSTLESAAVGGAVAYVVGRLGINAIRNSIVH